MSAFYDQASLVVVPSGYKSGKIYAQKPLTTDGQLTFTRASTATRVNASGLIETVASGVPRLDYTNSSCPKLLLEPQRTNLLTYSEQLDLQSLQGSPIITSNVAVSPDGYQNADKLTPNTGTANYVGATRIGMANNTYTVSMFAKADGKDWVFFYEIGSAAGTNGVWFNVATGTIGFVGSAWSNAKAEDYGNGWYRVSATTTLAGGNYLYWLASNDNNVSQLTQNGTDGVLMWGLSYEVGAYATSYIPTLGASVTRVADAAEKTGISSLIGQTEGTLFAEFDYNGAANSGQYERIIALGDGTSQNRIILIVNNTTAQLYAFIGSGGSIIINQAISGTNVLGHHKVAFAYKANDCAVYLDGVLVFSSTTAATIPATTAFFVGTDETGSVQPLGGGISQAIVFKTRLTNAQLAELTTL